MRGGGVIDKRVFTNPSVAYGDSSPDQRSLQKMKEITLADDFYRFEARDSRKCKKSFY